MAASKSYYARQNYRFLSNERNSAVGSDSLFKLNGSDVWNVSVSPESRKTVMDSRIGQSSSSVAVMQGEVGGTVSSLPVNVPDWSKILKEDYIENRRRDSDDDDFDDDYSCCDGDRIPPYEFLARTRMASFSVHEGIGRTLNH
ncbi:hypothetical protein LXL04_003454 [Taraxacum kok-saghyz]